MFNEFNAHNVTDNYISFDDNNAPINFIYISTKNKDNIDVSSWLEAINASNSAIKGRMKIFSPVSSENFVTLNVHSADTISPNVYRLGISYVAGNPLPYPDFHFYNDEEVVISFVPSGEKGDEGFITPGTQAGNTPYWDGSEWVVSSNILFNDGNSIGIGTNNPQELLDVSGNIQAESFVSSVTTGTAPLTVNSTTLVTNLNSDMIDGLESSDLMQVHNNLSDLQDFSEARTNLGLGASDSPTFSSIRLTGGNQVNGFVLKSDAQGNAQWQNPGMKEIQTNAFITISEQDAGKIIPTQWGANPVFPENLPDGFTCDIINYSNYPFTSNTLSTVSFITKTTGWNGGSGASSITIPSGGTVTIRVATVNGLKSYFITGDVN
ncbi:MAG: hypothetical protein DWQ44_11300 [Bacteroidetes bacterium]|nr:MAG: hypothetical protein DWQ33_09420 [Bacteroidota bacterium]REK05208.1 MAG: hypothetical protein DWQ39_08430 [Bacteroidota bacterium]REK32613.1 MAG: hypothetical protein DWQ44_11300 [Bacteroidota bacterium]REK48940.1 MAG: hypothetical protein DWQ48_08660 [Bacteroidota bacterium]